MYEEVKAEIIQGGLKLDRYGLIALSGGNLSVRVGDHVIITPSGMIYEDMVLDDLLVMDLEGSVIEGDRRPSVDTVALLYIYNHMPEVKAIIHTHQPYATAVGLVTDEFPCCLTTMANTTKGSVKVAPYTSAASEAMGVESVEHLTDGRLAVILKHHGVITVGSSLKEALYACVYLEEAAKTYVAAMSMGREVQMLTDSQVEEAVEVFRNYGQKPMRQR